MKTLEMLSIVTEGFGKKARVVSPGFLNNHVVHFCATQCAVVWTEPSVHHPGGHFLVLSNKILDLDWEIEPNYCSFSDAMVALEKDKFPVFCEFKDQKIIIFPGKESVISHMTVGHVGMTGGGADIKVAWICGGKWGICDEKK